MAFIRQTTEMIADELRPIALGFVARSPSLPDVWAMNHVRVTTATGIEDMILAADAELSSLPYRQIHIEQTEDGPELERTFRNRGWKLERELLMVLEGQPDRPADTSTVVEVAEDEMLGLMRRWFAAGPPPTSEQVLGQLVEYARRESRARGDTTFAVTGDSGRALAMAKLRSAGLIAQVEDVYTAPEARGRGYARAVVSTAVARARELGSELIFIVADDNDWPKQLYARIGFAPIARTWTVHRDLTARAGARPPAPSNR